MSDEPLEEVEEKTSLCFGDVDDAGLLVLDGKGGTGGGGVRSYG